ncbi:MAG: diguanylate cyclase [Patescibacteria group bacterium]
MERQTSSRERKTVSQTASEKFSADIRKAKKDLEDAIAIKNAEKKSEPEEVIDEIIRTKELALNIAERKKDIFLWERDATGAMKKEKFGKDLRTLIDTYGLERGPDGAISFKNQEAPAKTHLIQVNMGELDRLNSAGEHELGDRGLRLTFLEIQNKVEESIKKAFPEIANDDEKLAARYDIYRISGNDFSVVLKEVDQAVAEEIRCGLSIRLDISEIAPKEEPVPLTASAISFERGAALLESFGQPDETLGTSNETLFIDLLRDEIQNINEFEKIRTRGQRMVEKIREDNESRGQTDAIKFYDSFYKEPLGKLFLEEGEEGPLKFDDFKARLEKLGALEEHPQEWKARLFKISSDEAMRLCISRHTAESKKTKIILGDFISKLEQLAALEQLVGLDLQALESSKIKLREYTEASEEQTRRYEEKISGLGETDGSQVFKRLQDRQTELTDSHADKGEVELAELDLTLEKTKRDSATGLYGRGMYFQNLEKSLEKNAPVTAIAMDMAFLKFFDKEGGGKTGDQAIHSAGVAMDFVKRQVKEKYGVDIETYRTGGDEFALTVNTSDKNIVSEVIASIKKTVVEKMGPIPAYQGATERYDPEALRFNFGTFSIESADALRQKLDNDKYPLHHKPGSPEERQELSDALHRLADQRIEFEKAVDRFAFLLARLSEAEKAAGTDKEALKQNAAVLVSYSEKAIFGSAGRQKLAEWSETLKTENISIRELARTEVIPMVIEQLKEKGKKQEEFDEEYLKQVIENMRLTFANMRIGELQEDLTKTLGELGEEHTRVIDLQKSLKTAEEDREKIAGLRNRMSGA